jgi:hypothetical protein
VAARVTLLIAGAVFSAVVVASSGSAQDEGATPPPPGAVIEAVRQSPMGPVCWAAIVESIRQIGLRCHPNDNPVLMAELERSNDAMGAIFLERGWSPQQLEGFRRQMGEADEPTEQLCANRDAEEMYRGFASAEPAELRRTTEEMLARSGPPAWGTCL